MCRIKWDSFFSAHGGGGGAGKKETMKTHVSKFKSAGKLQSHLQLLVVIMKLPESLVYYLDDEAAHFTLFLLRHGVARNRLVPVNWDQKAARKISIITSCKCICSDFLDISFPDDAIVWYDSMKNAIDVRVYKHAKSAACLALTISNRGCEKVKISPRRHMLALQLAAHGFAHGTKKSFTYVSNKPSQMTFAYGCKYEH